MITEKFLEWFDRGWDKWELWYKRKKEVKERKRKEKEEFMTGHLLLEGRRIGLSGCLWDLKYCWEPLFFYRGF